MVIAYNVLAIGLILLALASVKYYGLPDDRHASYVRIAALGIVPLLISMLGNNAVGVQRLMLGSGIAVIIAEVGINRLSSTGRADRTKYLALLPILIPLGCIAPYASYISYFFGYDRLIMALGAFIVLFYLVLPKLKTEKQRRLIHLVVAGIGWGMWSWLAFRYSMTLM